MSLSKVELQQLMSDSAQDAVVYAQESHTVRLDHSEASLAQVDELVLLVREAYGTGIHDSQLIFTLCNMLGAYVGEIFKKNYGGSWIYDETDPQAPAVFLQHEDYTFAFSGIVYQRLITDQSLSIRLYYEEAKAKVEQ